MTIASSKTSARLPITVALLLGAGALLAACGSDDAPPVNAGGAGTTGAAGTNGNGGGANNTLCPATSPSEMMMCVSTERYTSDVTAIAVVRNPGSGPWKSVQDRCADTLAGLGFEVERHTYASGTNVVGTLKGTDRADELVLLGAHYDHLTGCLGADDNATGVAAVLEAARLFASKPWSRSLAIACWDEEELGCVGSGAWAKRAASNGQKISAVYNFDMIGYTDATAFSQVPPTELEPLFPNEYAELEKNQFKGNFILLMHDGAATAPASAFEKYFEARGRIASRLPIPANYVKTLDEVRRSDHRSFWDADLPAIMITDTGDSRNPGYHCKKEPDALDTLDYAFATDVVRAAVGSVAETLGTGTAPPPPPQGGTGGAGGAAGTSGTGGTTAVGGSSGSFGQACASLCKPTVTTAQTDCIIGAITAKGYPVASIADCADAAKSTAACLKCGKGLGLTDEVCQGFATSCLQ